MKIINNCTQFDCDDVEPGVIHHLKCLSEWQEGYLVNYFPPLTGDMVASILKEMVKREVIVKKGFMYSLPKVVDAKKESDIDDYSQENW